MSKIPITDALGLTKNMTPKDISARWIDWKGQFQEDYQTLSPAVTIPFDSLAVTIGYYDAAVALINEAEQLYQEAVDAYNVAIDVMTGGSAATLDIAKQARDAIYKEAAVLYKQLIDWIKAELDKLNTFEVRPEASLKY